MTEHELKSALVNHFSNHKQTVAIGLELPFLFGNRRADFFSINECGAAIGIEIKSSTDKIVRLSSQISDYRQYFDYVWVLCESDNIDAIRLVIPKTVGIYLAVDDSVVTVRKARRIKRLNKIALLSSINTATLKKRFRLPSSSSQLETCNFISSKNTLDEIRGLSRGDLIEKYKNQYLVLKNELHGKPNLDDLILLTRPSADRIFLPD